MDNNDTGSSDCSSGDVRAISRELEADVQDYKAFIEWQDARIAELETERDAANMVLEEKRIHIELLSGDNTESGLWSQLVAERDAAHRKGAREALEKAALAMDVLQHKHETRGDTFGDAAAALRKSAAEYVEVDGE